VLTPEALKSSFATLNPKGDGKITFNEFYAWLKSDKKAVESKDQKGKDAGDLAMLKLKLQSDTWVAKYDDFRSKISAKKQDSKDSKDEKKGDAKPAPAKDEKAMKLLNVALNVGEFKEAKAGVYVDIGPNPKLAEQLKNDVSCPEGVETFAYFDLGVKDGADDGTVGELTGALELMLKSVPFQKFPGNMYHSHTVDVAENENKKKVVRITLFSKFDPAKLISPMIEGSGVALKPSEILTGAVKVELPFAINEIKDKFRFTHDLLKLRLQATIDINRKMKDVLNANKEHMPPQARLSLLTFFVKGIDVGVNFANLSDLLKNIPDEPAPAGPYGRPGPGAELKGAIAMLTQMDIPKMLPLQMLPGLAAKVGQDGLYTTAVEVLTGLNRLHVQNHDMVVRVDLKGFDFITLFPSGKKGK